MVDIKYIHSVVRSVLKGGIKGLVRNLQNSLMGDEREILFLKTDSRELLKVFSEFAVKMPFIS